MGLLSLSSFTVGFRGTAFLVGAAPLMFTASVVFGRWGSVVAAASVVIAGSALFGPVAGAGHTAMMLVGLGVSAALGWLTHLHIRRLLTQRQAERLEFDRTSALLETEVKLRTHAQRELEHSYNAALEGTRVKAAFLANMSHELRTPMNAVVGLTDLVLRDELSAQQRESLETVRESSNGLLLLLDDLLDLSKVEAGALRLDRAPFAVREVLGQLDRLLRPRAIAKHIGFEVRLAGDVPEVLIGDSHRLTQVMTNLIGNAIKFTARGTVSIEVSWAAPKLALRVKDSGIGMTADQMSNLFQPFTQADVSMTREFGGTGLGLAIVKRLCELQLGTVEVESMLGAGSIFTATLEYELGSEMPAPERAKGVKVRPIETLGGLRVLVAEDNAVNRRVVQRLLERLGVAVTTVNNGAEALAQLNREPFDIVLMDLQMPVMDGLEATRRIRASGITQPAIIALSANAMAEDKRLAWAAGMNDFLAKPITLDMLGDALLRLKRAPSNPSTATNA